jgi:uncharacterized protein
MMDKPYALVTGATDGIGYELGKALSVDYNVVACGRFAARDMSWSKVLIYQDLSSNFSAARFKDVPPYSLKLLVNNVALVKRGTVGKLAPVDLMQMLMVNCYSMHRLTLLFYNELKANRGTVLNISSIGDTSPLPGLSCYAATKAFVTTYTNGLADEVRESGESLRVLCARLTATNTAGFRRAMPTVDATRLPNPVDVAAQLVDFIRVGVHGENRTWPV